MKEFATETSFDLREILKENYDYDERNFCEYDYQNKSTAFNITVDFEMNTITVLLNAEKCIQNRLSTVAFPENKATILMTGISPVSGPVQLTFHEITVSKEWTPLLVEQIHFTDTTNSLISSLQEHDPAHFTNNSLSNILFMDVF